VIELGNKLAHEIDNEDANFDEGWLEQLRYVLQTASHEKRSIFSTIPAEHRNISLYKAIERKESLHCLSLFSPKALKTRDSDVSLAFNNGLGQKNQRAKN
jgi:hypothetical protein